MFHPSLPAVYRRQSTLTISRFTAGTTRILVGTTRILVGMRSCAASWDARYTGRDVATERMRLAPRSCVNRRAGQRNLRWRQQYFADSLGFLSGPCHVSSISASRLPAPEHAVCAVCLHLCQPFSGDRASCQPLTISAVYGGILGRTAEILVGMRSCAASWDTRYTGRDVAIEYGTYTARS